MELRNSTMTMWREPEGYALPFYIANCDPTNSGANRPILGCSRLHFETSVSICNARPCEPEVSCPPLSVLLAELN